MGGSSSKSVINQLSEVISNIAMSTVQSCENSVDQTQNLEVNNSGFRLWGTYKLAQQTEIRSDCFSDVNKQADLQNKIISTIANASTASNVGLLGAFGSSKSYAETNLTNIVRNNVTMSNIQKSYNAIRNSQSAKFTNSGIIGFEQVELTQGAKLFAAATLQEVDKAGIFNAIEGHIDQNSQSTRDSSILGLGNLFGGLGDWSWVLVLVFLGALAYVGFAFYQGKFTGMVGAPPAAQPAAGTT